MLAAAPAFDNPPPVPRAGRPLRVCMFVTNCVSIDTRVIKEASTLTEAGHSVTVVGLSEEGQAAQEEIEGFAVTRVRRDTLHAAGPARRGPAAAASMAWALGDYSLRAVRATAGRYDVYHAHDLVTLPTAWTARRRSGGRLVYDAHELFTELSRLDPLSRAAFRALETVLIGRADRVVTVNDSIASELVRRYGIPAPVVVRNCPRTRGRKPDRARSPLRGRAGLGADVPIVLYQGLYMPHRGLENLVRAAAAFDRGQLVLMGWGPLRGALETLAAEVGVTARVTFLEPVPMDELLEATAGADLGVVPYRNVGLNNYYTSPNKLFEYCVAGVPVVASRFPELVKVVEGEGIGATFDPDHPASIAAAVNGLLGDAAALARARANLLAAAPSFTWEAESRKLLDVYSRLAPSR